MDWLSFGTGVLLLGAFVGALFAGVGPVEAAQFQIVVLAAIGFSGALTALICTRAAVRREPLPLRAVAD